MPATRWILNDRIEMSGFVVKTCMTEAFSHFAASRSLLNSGDSPRTGLHPPVQESGVLFEARAVQW